MTKQRNLLICFDAFGTLFKPKRPIEEQYTSVAHKFGVGLNRDGSSTFTSVDVRNSFRNAFKNSSREFPNYGRAVGMGAAAWWTKVITDTFTPLLPTDPSQNQQDRVGPPLPSGLAPALLHRFSSAEGYKEPSPGLRPLFDSLRSNLFPVNTTSNRGRVDNLVVGVITNSDDRVPDILSSFGLRVSPLRYGTDTANSQLSPSDNPPVADIDFHCISYDVGYEKPDRRIFEAAEGMVRRVHVQAGNSSSAASLENTTGTSKEDWIKLYVGDDYEDDVQGALEAGWTPVWIPELDANGPMIKGGEENYYSADIDATRTKYPGLEVITLDEGSVDLVKWGDVFGDSDNDGGSHTESRRVLVKCSSLKVLVDWLSRSM